MYWHEIVRGLKSLGYKDENDPASGLIWGRVVQEGTSWNPGLAEEEIDAFEASLGFALPVPYRELLASYNGSDRTEILYGKADSDQRQAPVRIGEGLGFYTYPRDWPAVQELLAMLAGRRQAVDEAISQLGLDPRDITGFVPLYARRVLVAFKDTSLCPVVACRGDGRVFVYGKTLRHYMMREFGELTERIDKRLIRKARASALALGRLECSQSGEAASKRLFRFLFEASYLEDAHHLKTAAHRHGYGKAEVQGLGEEFLVAIEVAMAVDTQAMALVTASMISLGRQCGCTYQGWENGEPIRSD